ncbi:serine hydrolase domain-containing protein [Cellulophaga tyrosinoxydans]|uniref:CubicO group peptidase, beta-lactamase class C family n=1 Tax=Cellulophaga tyrosinoxydans TaxID=504486 RepID=A0A1W1ZS20_9FLAO|nr:serine hydrolase domain-containing protein [Cellulophaga tyrosinoxydans]SMC51002.1 CubicO group peptidase, beta-lactamase class C family [Cellulophaga tyrosinoxydans]
MKNVFQLIFTLTSLISVAQTTSIKNSPFLTEASPKSVGMSEERLARIDAMCAEAVKNEVPGIVALVARNGKIVFHKAYGTADAESTKELKTDAIFRIASQTKAITSTAVMMLWEEGKFRLDDPISKYIPEFSNEQILDSVYPDGSYSTIPAKNPITIRHLLSHTSGIGYGVIDGDSRFKKIYANAGITDLFTTEKITIAESVKKLAKLPLHHNPGEKYTYSEGLDVLGYFIEIMSGMPLDQFLRKRILDPLQMNDTWFYLPKALEHRLVSVQTKENNQWKNYPKTFYDTNYPKTGAKAFFSGGAGLSSTAKDYANFLQMYLNKGELNGIRILSRTTVDVIMANQIGTIWEGGDANFGLAFRVINENGVAKGGQGSLKTFNWGGYFNSQYFADPKEQVIGIILKQTRAIEGDNTAWKFQQLVGQSIDD